MGSHNDKGETAWAAVPLQLWSRPLRSRRRRAQTRAAEIKVLSSHAININEAYIEFTAMFEKASDHRVATTFTTGWAGTPEITKRLQGGEMYDLVIGSRQLIDDMIKEGRLLAGNRVDLAKSGVGVAVRAGAPKPDIASTEAVKRALLAAKSIGYSTGPSGVYLVGLISAAGSRRRNQA